MHKINQSSEQPRLCNWLRADAGCGIASGCVLFLITPCFGIHSAPQLKLLNSEAKLGLTVHHLGPFQMKEA